MVPAMSRSAVANTQKNGGYELEHVFGQDEGLLRSFYYLLQIAHLILQLVEHGSLLRHAAAQYGQTVRRLYGSLRNVAARLLECLRYRVIPAEAFASNIRIQTAWTLRKRAAVDASRFAGRSFLWAPPPTAPTSGPRLGSAILRPKTPPRRPPRHPLARRRLFITAAADRGVSTTRQHADTMLVPLGPGRRALRIGGRLAFSGDFTTATWLDRDISAVLGLARIRG
jgi:hypothetical protein